jgi:YfiH family protein
MKIIKSTLFAQFPEIIFGMSTKFKISNNDKFGFNMSYNVGDDKETVLYNRKLFYETLDLQSENVAYQNQIHSDIVTAVGYGGNVGNSDALITPRKGIGLAVLLADCVGIFIYDKKAKVVAAVHSGWRGTKNKILRKTLLKMHNEFDSLSKNLFVFIAPSISQKNYEVGKEVAKQFPEKYVSKNHNKFLLDVSGYNYDMLIDYGVPEKQIEKSSLCSYDTPYLHSFRRDKQSSGRAFGIIAIKG